MKMTRRSSENLAVKYKQVFATHRIELFEALGEGGEAPVYRGRRLLGDGETYRNCAVKIYELRDESAGIPAELRSQFRILHRVENHPHVIRLHEIIVDSKFVALEMELGGV